MEKPFNGLLTAEEFSLSLKIAIAAIQYQLLKTDTGKNMIFNPNEAIRFEADTGPYILYSYARASSILSKTEMNAITDSWYTNEFYYKCPVLRSKIAAHRLALVSVFRKTFGICLDLSGIDKIEEM